VRIGLVIAGVIVLAIGVVLAFVPLVQAASQDMVSNPPIETEFHGYAWNVTGFSITGNIPVSTAWTSTGPATFVIQLCSNGGFNPYYYCTGTSHWPGNQSGTSGSETFNVPSGATLLVYLHSENATTGHVNVDIAQTTIGLILIVIGLILLVLGIVLGRKSRAAPAPPPSPSTPSPPPPSS
jgi:uncharacterized membrane protein